MTATLFLEEERERISGKLIIMGNGEEKMKRHSLFTSHLRPQPLDCYT